MKAVYIGILTTGTTSRLRAERLRAVTPGWEWDWIDTDVAMRAGHRMWRTLAFRVKAGPVVSAINRDVRHRLDGKQWDVAWVDKGVFLDSGTMRLLRERCGKLVHFTPDTAFYQNRSRWFDRSLGLYDVVVTTKSFEVGDYERRGVGDRLVVTTQGFDKGLHHPGESREERRREVAFVGLAEPDREVCVGALLDAGVPVRLGGRGWGRLVERYGRCEHLRFEGAEVFGEDYRRVLAGAWVGLGFLSKRFPELHTTRTFEIPACGAVLATEATAETVRFFDQGEALFFDGVSDLVSRVKEVLAGPKKVLGGLADAGRARVLRDGRDYDSILKRVLRELRLQT